MSFAEETAVVEVLAASARAANATSGGMDTWATRGRAREMMLAVSAGAVTGTLDVRVQHADNDVAAEYVDVPNGAVAQLAAPGFRELHVRNFRRFVRVIAAVGGATPSSTFSVLAVFGRPLDAPI